MRMPGGSGAAPGGAPVAANTVSIKGFAFAPASVSVKVGTTVTWTNKDEEPHTVAANGGSFHSAPLTPGAAFRYRFTKPGRYPYVCTIHPFMHGTVVVTP
jgi:plastocyanin